MAEVVDVDIADGVPTTGTGTVPTLSKVTAATKVDDAAFTPASDRVVMIGAFADEAATDSVDEGDAGVVRMTLDRKLHVQASVISGGVASGAIATGAVASGAVASGAFASGALAEGAIASGAIASGALASGSIAAGAIAAGATSIAENEDEASANGDRGVKILFKRLNTPANSSGADGDYEQPQMAAGRVWTSATIDAALPAGTNNIGDVDVLTVTTGTAAANLGKAVDAAAGGGDTGVAVLAVRDDSLSELAQIEGDYAQLRVSSSGALHVTGGGGGTQYTEDAAAASDPTGTVLIGIRRDVLSASEVSGDGDNIAIKASSKGQLHVVTASGDPIITAIEDSVNFAAGTAGSASSDVMSVQGVASMVPLSTGGISNVYSVTPTLDTAAYSTGNLLADTQQMDAFFRVTNGTGTIQSISIIDEEAQNVKFYIVFMKTSTSLGTENSDPNISDANLSAGYLGHVTVETTDWLTISGCSVACIKNIGLPVEAVSGTDDLYFAIVNATGAPDWDADSLKLQIGVLLD
jgi:hypothetical protein